ncbi:hypothetical protein F5Y06DRAFT_239508 [Hypoxylon sp. FL0890]|nr:hypothetical protein F5Y06DRAFT_239508 [Hypoxylon sp. FL0890]
MSIDIRDLSDANVRRLTRVLCRRPEYGIAIPSRRWLSRQEEKIKSLPREVLHTPSLFKRLALKIVNSVDPGAVDPRAILCKTHSALNPWLIRRLFLAIAYEVTVHTDALRSWKEKRNYPILAAFVGRVDAIAALWTEPSLYRECYGTPPFENHMVFVQSGCEACILAALGANARVLADIRAILIDRAERRSPRQDGRPAKDPRLSRYVEEWIDHLKPERAEKCRAMSDVVLAQLRVTRHQLLQWRNRRRKEKNDPKVYTELKNTRSGPRLSRVPSDARRKRRTRNGIPVAMADLEGAEEQRRIAMFSMTQEENAGNRSIFRPDSLCDNSRFGQPRGPAYDPTAEQLPPAYDNIDQYDDYEEDVEGQAELERDLVEEEASRRKVADWYATRVEETHTNLSADDAKTVLSMVHPAFRPLDAFSQPSAAPQPLRVKKDRPPTAERNKAPSTVWTDATVYTLDPGSVANPGRGEVPPVPRVPSAFRREETRRSHGGSRTPSVRSTPRPRSSVPAHSSSQAPTRVTMSSSVYSDQLPARPHPAPSNRASMPSSIPPRNAARKFNFNESEVDPRVSASQGQYPRSHQGMRPFSRENNPFARENSHTSHASRSSNNTPFPAPLSGSGSGSGSRFATPVPSMSSYGNTVNDNTDGFEPSTPTIDEDMWRQSWGVLGDEEDDIRPEDSLTMAMWRAEDEDDGEEVSPWSFFRRKDR